VFDGIEQIIRRNDITMTYRIVHYDNKMKIIIAESQVRSIGINIHNLLGTRIKSQTFNLNGGYQEFTIDLTEFESGAYVYSIVSDKIFVNSGKLLIVK